MTEIRLYKFIVNNDIEWHYQENDGIEDVLIFPSVYIIGEFCDLLGPTIFDDEGIVCNLKDGYLAIWMREICDYFGFEMENIFDKEEDEL